jgi:IS4 transposase
MQGGRTGPADDFAAPQIEDGRQIKPAFGRFQVGDVGYAARGITDIMPGAGLCRVAVFSSSEEAVVDAA